MWFYPEARQLIAEETFEIIELSDELSQGLAQAVQEQRLNHPARVITQIAGVALSDIKAWDNGAFMPQTPIVHIIKNCNSPCRICDCWQTRDKIWHSARELLPVLEAFAKGGAKSIMVSGGEPTLHPELEEIIDMIHGLGMQVELNTNGIVLGRREWLRDKEISALIISMDGLDGDSYRQTRGRDVFDKVMMNLERFREASPQTIIGIRVTLTKYNLTRLKALVAFCKQHGIDSVGFSPLDVTSTSFNRQMTSSRQQELTDLFIPDQSILEDLLKRLTDPNSSLSETITAAHQSRLFSWPRERFIDVLTYYQAMLNGEEKEISESDVFPCLFPNLSAVVDYDGRIKPCFYAQSYADLTDFDLAAWDVKKMQADLLASGICQGCRGKVFNG